MDRLGIRSLFDAISDGYSVERQKPAPDLFLHAAAQLGLPPRNVSSSKTRRRASRRRMRAFQSIGLGPPERVGSADAVFPSLAGVRLADLLKAL